MTEEGKLITCDRCGKTEFVKLKGQQVLDGGFTRNNTFEESAFAFEKLPTGYVNLCPDCHDEFVSAVNRWWNQKPVQYHSQK